MLFGQNKKKSEISQVSSHSQYLETLKRLPKTVKRIDQNTNRIALNVKREG